MITGYFIYSPILSEVCVCLYIQYACVKEREREQVCVRERERVRERARVSETERERLSVRE